MTFIWINTTSAHKILFTCFFASWCRQLAASLRTSPNWASSSRNAGRVGARMQNGTNWGSRKLRKRCSSSPALDSMIWWNNTKPDRIPTGSSDEIHASVCPRMDVRFCERKYNCFNIQQHWKCMNIFDLKGESTIGIKLLIMCEQTANYLDNIRVEKTEEYIRYHMVNCLQQLQVSPSEQFPFFQ